MNVLWKYTFDKNYISSPLIQFFWCYQDFCIAIEILNSFLVPHIVIALLTLQKQN